jgi:A/G-specific adenine glycosylase
VETVIPFYERFLRALPTVTSLAEAPEEQVLALWSGLGYYRRARMLRAAAQRVAASHAGQIPSALADLRALEGVGAYTAGAVASIAFGRRAAVVDGNVGRVLARIFAIDDDVKSSRGSARIWRLADSLVADAEGDPGDWNQALMELGATVCLPRTPRCGACPVQGDCAARAAGLTGALPRVTPRREPREMRRVALVLFSKDAVLLARRRVDILFGGLWEPPSAAEERGAEEARGGGGARQGGSEGGLNSLAASLGMDARDIEVVGEVTHVLSHRRLRVQVARGALGRRRRFPIPGPEYDAVARVALMRLGELPQASLSRRILEVANVASRGLL